MFRYAGRHRSQTGAFPGSPNWRLRLALPSPASRNPPSWLEPGNLIIAPLCVTTETTRYPAARWKLLFWSGRPSIRCSREKRERASDCPLPRRPGRLCRPRHCHIPQRRVQPQVVPNPRDLPRPNQAIGRRAPQQAASEQPPLDHVIDSPEIVSDVFLTLRHQDLGRPDRTSTVLWKPQGEGLGRELDSLRHTQMRVLHPLHRCGEYAKALAHLERRSDDFLEYVAAVQGPPDRECTHRGH